MPEVPQKFQVLAIMQIVAGLVNLTVGWGVSFTVLMFGGTFCTAILTLGMCPIGSMCGFLGFLIIPVAMLEIVLGVLMLASPDTVKGVVAWVPFLQLPMLLLGDFITPIIGLVGLFLSRDPEVAGYIEGI